MKVSSIGLVLGLLSIPALAEPPLAAGPFTPVDRGMTAKSGLPVKLPVDPLGLNGNGAGVSVTDSDGFHLTGDPISDLLNFFLNGLPEATALTTQIAGLHDDVANACFTAAGTFQSVMTATAAPGGHSLLGLTGKPTVDLETVRLRAAAAKQLCSTPACQQLAAEFAQSVDKLVSLKPVTPIDMNSICAKLPTVTLALTPANTTPTPTATPTPSPAPTK